jgi:hypothetical protein
MQLDSYLEIFTTIYGWAFANLLGEILTKTGIAAIPFALILFNAWRDAKERGEGQNIISILESISTKLWTAIVVMALCFAATPLASLTRLNLNYTPSATFDDPNPQNVDKQTKDAVLTIPFGEEALKSFDRSGDISYVPIWWMSIMAVSNGINNAFRAGLANADNDFRRLEDIARTSTIEDPELLKSIQDFYSQCFAPARSKFLRERKISLSPAGQAIISDANKDYGPMDTDWIGSQLYRTEPGYYAEMRSYNPVPGWPIDFSRDVDYIQVPAPEGDPHYGYVNPDWGRPTCKQWWEDEAQGVRAAMIGHSSQWRVMAQQALRMASSPDKSKDSVAKLAQTQARPMYVSPDAILGAQHDAGTVTARAIGGLVSTAQTGIMALVTNITVGALHNNAMMAQALILMGLYMFLPLVTVLSGYDLRVFFLGALAIFTVKFWAVMWYVANWLDGRLIKAMYEGNFNVDYLVQMLQNGNKRMLLNVMLLTMYIGLPLLWTSMMGFIGAKSIEPINGLKDAGNIASNTAPKKLR